MRMAGLALAAGVFCAPGCANHGRYLDVQEDRVDTLLVDTEYEVDGGDVRIVASEVRLSFFKIDHFEDRAEQTTIKFEEYTPYQAARELYEVPAGLVSVPLSLAFNALRVASLFYIPGEAVDAYTDWTYAALNPFMNVESSDRVVRERIAVTDTEKSSEHRRVRMPLVGAHVAARYDLGAPASLATDESGVVSFHLLDAVSPSMGPRPRKLRVSLEMAPDSDVAHEYFIRRGLARRLGLARRPMLIVNGIPDDPQALGDALYALDRLGFPEYSVRLEDEIVTRNQRDEEFVQAFRDALDALYESSPGPVSAQPAQESAQEP
jgi:hypothetical protein